MIRKRPFALALLVAGSLLPTLAGAQPAPPPVGGPDGPPPAMPTMAQTRYDTMIEIRDGQLVKGEASAKLGATFARDVKIAAARDGYNGIIVSGGRSAVALKNVSIDLAGMGKNDFLAIGAGALVHDKAAVVIDHATIRTAGAVASALTVAEGATLRVYDSHLIAMGGPLPKDYVRHLGPGMMEPPAPLGLDGTARTVLAMSNAQAYFYRTTIEADGWGALSTDAAGGHLYVEANDSVLRVTRRGYGTYADFGAHVVLNRTVVESGGEAGIIAGEARIDMNRVSGKAARAGVMIHSVMGNPQEVATLNLIDTTLITAGPVLLVKSANAAITVEGGNYTSASGQLLELRKNDDSNATRTDGAKVPGVRLVLRKAALKGDIVSSDKDRSLMLNLEGTRLEGALRDVVFNADSASQWRATGASQIVLAQAAAAAAIDAPEGITVQATSHDAALVPGARKLPSGGVLVIAR